MQRESISERRGTQQMENARVGYQVATNLLNHEEQQMVARSSAMLTANSIIVASIAILLVQESKLALFCQRIPLVYVLSAVGIVICLLWLCMAFRTMKKAHYWSAAARGLGKSFLCNPVQSRPYSG